MDNGQKTILLVEDDVILCAIEKRTIEGFGYRVVTASAGEKAVEIAISDDTVDLVLMDIDLGSGFDGTEAARRILDVRNIPVVFLTSHSEREMVEKVRGITRYGYIIKDSGNFVLQSSIEMAFELFEAHKKSTENEARFEAFMNYFPSLVLIKDHELRPVYFNRAMSKYFPVGQWLGKTPRELFPPDVAEEMEKMDFEALEKGTSSYEEIWTDKNGDRRVFSTQKFRLDVAGKKPFLGAIISDVTESRRLEKTLRESERNYRELFDFSNDAIFIHDAVTGEIIDVNETMVKMYGYDSREEIRNCDKLDLMANQPPYTAEAAYRYIQKTVLEGPQAFEWLGRKKNGEFFMTEVSLKKTEIGGKGIIFAVVREIDERKKAEEKLRNARILLQQAFEQSPVPMLLVSMPDAVIRIVNPACVEFLGTGDEPSAIGTSLFDYKPSFIDCDSQMNPGLIKDLPLARALKGIITSNEERVIVRKDGSMRWELLNAVPIFDDAGDIIAGYLIMNDITDQKKLVEALRASDEKYRSLFENSPVSLWEEDLSEIKKYFDELRNSGIADFRSYFENSTEAVLKCACLIKVVDVNHESLKLFGAANKDMLMHDMAKIFTDDSLKVFREELIAMAEGVTDFKCESPIRTLSGEIKIVMRRFSVVEGGERDLGRVYVSFVDITERKKSEERINGLLKEKEILLKEVHHRIKNNMNNVMALLAIQAGTLKDGIASDALVEARNRVGSMMFLYDKLYLSSGFNEVSIDEYLAPLVGEIVRSFPNGDAVRIEARVGNFALRAKTLFPLGIIVNEITTNSMKHAFAGRNEGLISVSAERTAGKVRIEIGDDGCGLGGSDSAESRSGFGLSLIEMLTSQLGGTLKIERERGTKFILEFEEPEES